MANLKLMASLAFSAKNPSTLPAGVVIRPRIKLLKNGGFLKTGRGTYTDNIIYILERETETETDRQTDRQRVRETERQRGRERERRR